MAKTMVSDLTEGNVTKLLLKFAAPLFVSNALQAVYNLVDMVIVGQYIGRVGMSAVSIGGDILHLLTFLAMGFSAAGQVLIAQDVGANNMDGVRKTIGTLFTAMLGASVVMSVLCIAFRHSVLSWMNTPEESFAFTMDYMVTCAVGLLFIYGYNIVSAILRGMGDSKRPFVFIAIAAVMNTVLDLLFVIVFDMKVFGAALATVIGQGASFVISLIYLYRRRENFGFDFQLAGFRIEEQPLKRLLALGIPMAIQSAAVNFSKIIVSAWINAFGVVYSALAGLYNKIQMMVGIVSNSFTTAGSTMVGQSLGAGKTHRVPKILWTILAVCSVIGVALGLIIWLKPNAVFGMFTGDVEVLSVAAIIVGPIIVNLGGAVTRSMSFALINGSGNTKLNLAVALIDGMISRIGIAALMGFAMQMGSVGFLYGDAIAGYVPLCIGLVYLISGSWKTFKRAV
ncbi:MAG: MATE family efflux transporter [Clostridia bacterium]|nr:MATE family efflux transporter [Clostridia bacterium]